MCDEVYRERAHLLAHLAACYPSHFQSDPETPDWPVLFITIPALGTDPGPTVRSRHGYTISAVDADLLDRRWYVNGRGYFKRQAHLPEPKGYLHRVIAERIFGEIPDGYEVDHINRDPSDNTRWNLRLATPRVQRLNIKRRSVRQRKNGRWQALRNDTGRQLSLGTYDTEAEAVQVVRVYRSNALHEAIAAGELKTWTTQACWHINPDDLDLFSHVPEGLQTWDGHTTDEKYERLDHATRIKVAGTWVS